MSKYPVLVLETILILGFLLVGGCITAVVLRPESGVGIVVIVTSLTGIATGTILQLRAAKANGAKIDSVAADTQRTKEQTNGINSVLLANLQAMVRHITGDERLSTGEIETIRDVINDNKVQIDKQKGIRDGQ